MIAFLFGFAIGAIVGAVALVAFALYSWANLKDED